MSPSARIPLYFVGWNYHEPIGVPLKRLLENTAAPFDVKAIVHQVVMAPEVDGIPIIQNDEFIARAKAGKVQAVLMVKDDLSRSLWLRRGREIGVEWLDEGELLQIAERSLQAKGAAIDLGVLALPDAFNAESIEPLQAFAGTWPDAASNGVFRAYMQFLETGVLSPLRSAASHGVEHPMRQKGTRSVAACADALGGGIAWEISNERSSFLEQVALVAGRNQWRYAFSSEEALHCGKEARALRTLLSPLGIQPAASWLEATKVGVYREHAITSFELPVWKDVARFVRIDVANSVATVNQLANKTQALNAWIRVGRTPQQLLGLLQRFPICDMSLNCDRPGPLGLQVQLQVNA